MREIWEIPFEQLYAMDKTQEYMTPPWEGKSEWKAAPKTPPPNPKPKFKKYKKEKRRPKYFNPAVPPTEFKIPPVEYKKVEKVSCDTCKRQVAPINQCVCLSYQT